MPKIAAIALAALIVASIAALAGIMAAFADGEPQLNESGRRLDCIPASAANPAGDCLWTPKLTKVEVKVEFEYPYCVVKLDVESNLNELPDGAGIATSNFTWRRSRSQKKSNVGLLYVQSDDTQRPLAKSLDNWSWDSHRLSGIGHTYNDEMIAHYPGWDVKTYKSLYGDDRVPFRYKTGETDWFRTLTDKVLKNLPQSTLGKVYMYVDLEYSGEFVKPKPTGNGRTALEDVSPGWVWSNSIPISHTFAGLIDEMFTCMDVAEREEERVAERIALESQKAGLRQSLTLLKSELSRARQHELDATGILKEVIDVSEKVEEMLRTIQRVRVEGLAERRQIVERYYSEESQRYSVFIQSLEGSQAALAAADAAIAAHKAELDRSRAELERIVKEAQDAEAELIAEIEEAEKALGNDEE